LRGVDKFQLMEQKHNVTLDPPIQNLHGSMYFDGKIYGCTDGGNETYASIVEIDVKNNFSVKYLVNNWFGHPFAGFNDLFVDKNSNIW
jgi:gluconolactonase